MGQIDAGQWSTFLIVLAALFAAIVLLGNVVKTFKDWRKPAMDVKKRLDDHDKFLAADKQRIERLEHDLHELSTKNAEAQAILMKAVIALLNHAIHDGNTDEMEMAKKI